jgi:hypothetical protein
MFNKDTILGSINKNAKNLNCYEQKVYDIQLINMRFRIPPL